MSNSWPTGPTPASSPSRLATKSAMGSTNVLHVQYERAARGKNSGELYALAALCQLRADGGGRRAVELARRAVALGPTHVPSRTALARAYFHEGMTASALAELARALEVEPKNEEAKRLQGEFKKVSSPGQQVARPSHQPRPSNPARRSTHQASTGPMAASAEPGRPAEGSWQEVESAPPALKPVAKRVPTANTPDLDGRAGRFSRSGRRLLAALPLAPDGRPISRFRDRPCAPSDSEGLGKRLSQWARVNLPRPKPLRACPRTEGAETRVGVSAVTGL